jgi:hypothetical protein
MHDRDDALAEPIRIIAGLLASAYLRLRFPEAAQKPVDSSETESPHGTAG